jgi:hypothetical protein
MAGNIPVADGLRGGRRPLSEHPRKKVRRQARLITRVELDGRTRARKLFDRIATGIAADLGGKDRLTTVEMALVEAFAGAALHLHNLNARLMLGEAIDLSEHAHAVSSLVRVASRIGTGRRPRDVTPQTLQQYLASMPPEDEAQTAEAADEEA